MRIMLAQINPIIGDITGNLKKILQGIELAKSASADLVLFPELALCGYPPEDFLLLPHFISALELPLEDIKMASKGITVVVGTPRKSPKSSEKALLNSAAIFSDGKLIGYQDKILLPTYDVFTERRYFEPGEAMQTWNLCGKKIGITICEDIWRQSEFLTETIYDRDPVSEIKDQRPDLLLNLSASPFSLSKEFKRFQVCQKAALHLQCPVLLCNQVGGNDGLIFDGHSLHVGSDGGLRQIAKEFEEDHLLVDLAKNYPMIDWKHSEQRGTESLYRALVLGVKDYFGKSGFKKACLGLSGGIDSAVVACIAAEALGPENVLGVNMPSRFSSVGSIEDSKQLAKTLDLEYREISIEQPFESYLDLLAPVFEGKLVDTTEENLQSRIRGMILMALSNKFGYIVISTGNKSELALGYSTLYGDMCGGLAIISDLTKRQVYEMAAWINRDKEIIPQATIDKPPSAELRFNQKDSDSLPNYDIVDIVVQAYVEEHLSPEEIIKKYNFSPDIVYDLVKRIHANEYKRRQSPLGLRVSEKSFSIGRRFPIVQRWV